MEPPVPIPNTEVKRRSANGSRTIGPARVGRCQINSPLTLTGGRAVLAYENDVARLPPRFRSFALGGTIARFRGFRARRDDYVILS